MYRSPKELHDINAFLIADPIKDHVMAGFATGFVAHFEYPLPSPWGSVRNYPSLTCELGKLKFSEEMRKQVIAGKMIGGPGWSAQDVRSFLGCDFYGIPCHAVEKNGDPYGRIVHDYGYHKRRSYSINASHSCTTVTYTSFRETVEIGDGVC